MIRDPSGDQRGLLVMNVPMEVNFLVFDPPSLHTQISRVPLRSEAKATCLPSGEYCGLKSIRVDATKRLGVPGLPPESETSVRQTLMSVDFRAYTNLPCRE